MSHEFSQAFSGAFDVDHIPVGNWNSLLGMIQEAADIDKQESQGPPTSCPVDYTALRQGPNGTLFCPWGCGLVWPDDASAWGNFPGSF